MTPEEEVLKLREVIKDIARHVAYVRFVEARYREVGKEKYAWSKLNGPMSAIERCLSEVGCKHVWGEKTGICIICKEHVGSQAQPGDPL